MYWADASVDESTITPPACCGPFNRSIMRSKNVLCSDITAHGHLRAVLGQRRARRWSRVRRTEKREPLHTVLPFQSVRAHVLCLKAPASSALIGRFLKISRVQKPFLPVSPFLPVGTCVLLNVRLLCRELVRKNDHLRVHSLNNVPYLAWNLESRCVLGAYLR